MLRIVLSLLAVSVLCARAEWDLAKMVSGSGSERIFRHLPVDGELRNPWPRELEAKFQARARRIIDSLEERKGGVNTYFENEKRSYGVLMAHVLSSDEDKSAKALEDLQARDHQHEEWHRETEGIDYYAAFTLKHQMRKYFYFGDLLDPAYRRKMFEGAKKWTAKDPLRRPHYAYKKGTQGWGPNAKNSWVDVRSTENLYHMRVTSVYLMAEETGNKDIAALYKRHILDYTKTLYRIGIGEWDSENYHGHSIAPLLNLYDFAKDREVQRAAKACLDFMAAAGAVKYYRGGFNGPTRRDYNHAQPFGGSAANALWVWFGEHPQGKTDDWEADEVHMITSGYRPPLAVVNLARKKFDKPLEIFAAKPPYSATTSHQSESEAQYLETQYVGHSFQMGSLTNGTCDRDVNGFKLLVFNEKDGAVAIHGVPGPDAAYAGSPMYRDGKLAGQNRVAQLENLAIWLVKHGGAPWRWVVPEGIAVRREGGVTFLEGDRTWVAIRPLGASEVKVDDNLTKELQAGEKSRFPGHRVLAAEGDGGSFCGMAIEVGDKVSHGSFGEFRKAVRAAEVDVSDLDDGAARYKASDGKWLGIHWNDDPLDLGVWRNGERRDLEAAAQHLYDSPVISSEWGSGVLDVNAGGASFHCRVDESGKVVFE